MALPCIWYRVNDPGILTTLLFLMLWMLKQCDTGMALKGSVVELLSEWLPKLVSQMWICPRARVRPLLCLSVLMYALER